MFEAIYDENFVKVKIALLLDQLHLTLRTTVEDINTEKYAVRTIVTEKMIHQKVLFLIRSTFLGRRTKTTSSFLHRKFR